MPERFDGSIFWLDVHKVKPNPLQPRREFNEDRLRDLADSIRQYGVLQPLVVTRREVARSDGGLEVEYELIAGERRLRAAKIAGLSQIPSLIKDGVDSDKLKLEIAIIENLQREDLNPVERARGFLQLAEEFGLKHVEIAKKIGMSREYVSNTIRMMSLPAEILAALEARQINEGHTKAILMLADRPAEQLTVFKEVVYKRLTVRETENIARRIAYDRVRNKDRFVDPVMIELEEKLTEKLGARVTIEKREVGGKVTIDFFSQGDLLRIMNFLETSQKLPPTEPGPAQIDQADNQTDGASDDDSLYDLKNWSL